LTLASVAAVVSANNEYEFMSYIVEFNKSYNSLEEYHMRMDRFLAKDVVIREHNGR